MSEGMIIRRGGGASLKATDALLRVQAPAGSTVTITKGSVSKTDLGHENADDHTVYDYYFIIHQSQFDSVNPWTVTATLGSDTTSDTVIINAADEYDVAMYYTFYLFHDGDERTSITGGWTQSNWTSGYWSWGTFENADGKLKLSATGSGNMAVGVSTVNKIDLTNFNTLKFTITDRQFKGVYCGLASNQTQGELSPQFYQDNTPVGTYTLDISNITGSWYVQVRAAEAGSSGTKLTAFNNIILE